MMKTPFVRLVAWQISILPVLLILGGALHHTDCRLVGLCIGLLLEVLVAILAARGMPRCTKSLGVCLCVAVIGWASLALVVKTSPAVGNQALLPLRIIAAAARSA